MTLSAKDERIIWHPYTHQKNKPPQVPIVRGEKACLYDDDGNSYIDGISSWWVNIHGHGNKFIAKEIYEQASKIQQVIFTGFTHKPAVDLAEKLLKVLPGDYSRVFYSDNGSTATEVAIKMGLQYWVNAGATGRNKVLALNHAYHGDTFGAMSVSNRGTYTIAFRDKLFDVLFIDPPCKTNLELIKEKIENHRDEIACFIYEPLLQGAGGMKMYDPEDLNELLGIVKKEEIICIADEVLTGFFRTGKFFAGDYLLQKADIICLSKALTGGSMALGVTACTNRIYESFVSDDKTKTLFHGHSFTANPLACTASLASMKLIEKKNFRKKVDRIVQLNKSFAATFEKYQQKNIIKNIRQLGTIVAFEIVTSERDGYLHNISADFTKFCLSRGVFLRSLGNTVYVMPPYCITKKELKKIYSVIGEFLTSISESPRH